MGAVEINSEHFGVLRAALMENAGRQVFLALKKRFRLRGKAYVKKKKTAVMPQSTHPITFKYY